jgi:hypothetical protein
MFCCKRTVSSCIQRNVFQIQQVDYTVFNSELHNKQQTIILSLYDMPPTYFGFNKAILMEVSKKGIKLRLILFKMFICGIKNQRLQLKLLQLFNM